MDWVRRLAGALPHPLPSSNNNLLPIEKALAFTHGWLCDARKLTHITYLRRDPMVPELLGIRRVASQSVLSRFFAGFTSARANLRCFRPLWQGGLNRLPSALEVTPWTWIRRGSCTRMDIRMAWPRVIPDQDSSPACIHFWLWWPRCAWWRRCGCDGQHVVRR